MEVQPRGRRARAGQLTLQEGLEEADELLLIHGCYAFKCSTDCLERMVSRSRKRGGGEK